MWRCRGHRERRRTTSQTLENAALRVDLRSARAALWLLDDAAGIAGATTSNTHVSLVDAVHNHYADRLLKRHLEAGGQFDAPHHLRRLFLHMGVDLGPGVVLRGDDQILQYFRLRRDD